MSTPLSDLKAPSQDRPSQNIMYDPNMKEETKKMESNTKPDDMTELISGIQENKQFVTLPSSDIPTTSSHLSTDAIIQPNHIPENTNSYRIDEMEDDIDYTINANVQPPKESPESTEKFILPIIIFLVTLALESPVTLKYVYRLLPRLFRKDGHPCWYFSAIRGLILSCIVYYFLYG